MSNSDKTQSKAHDQMDRNHLSTLTWVLESDLVKRFTNKAKTKLMAKAGKLVSSSPMALQLFLDEVAKCARVTKDCAGKHIVITLPAPANRIIKFVIDLDAGNIIEEDK